MQKIRKHHHKNRKVVVNLPLNDVIFKTLSAKYKRLLMTFLDNTSSSTEIIQTALEDLIKVLRFLKN
jgi:hypothetical protein